MTAKTPAKGHTAKHAATRKHAAGRKHAPVKQAKPVTGKLQPVHTVGTPATPAKPRGFAVGDVLPVCAFEAVAMSLRLAGQFVDDDEVAGLWSLTGAPALGASLAAALDAAGEYGLAGFRPQRARLRLEGRHAHEYFQLKITQHDTGPFGPLNDFPSGDLHALILGVDAPGPHAVLATPGGWWSWGELYDPWPCRIEEAWFVSWEGGDVHACFQTVLLLEGRREARPGLRDHRYRRRADRPRDSVGVRDDRRPPAPVLLPDRPDAVPGLAVTNYQYAYPWTMHLDQPLGHDLWVLSSLDSPAGTSIPLWQVFLEPVNRKPGWPFTRIELDRSTTASWGGAPTPQHSIVPTGTWGWYNPQAAGTLAANALSSDVSITVSDGSQAGAGDLLIVNPGTGAAPFPAFPGTAGALGAPTGERVIVTGKSTVATGLTQAGGGCATPQASDNALFTSGSGSLNAGEVILLDTEQMLVTNVTGGVATVKRAWNGTVLGQHGTATVYAYRSLSVLRAQLGTTAAGYTAPVNISKHYAPGLIRDLAIAESLNRVLQETSGYARTVGSGESAMPVPGAGLADLWNEAETVFGRKARIRAI